MKNQIFLCAAVIAVFLCSCGKGSKTDNVNIFKTDNPEDFVKYVYSHINEIKNEYFSVNSKKEKEKILDKYITKKFVLSFAKYDDMYEEEYDGDYGSEYEFAFSNLYGGSNTEVGGEIRGITHYYGNWYKISCVFYASGYYGEDYCYPTEDIFVKVARVYKSESDYENWEWRFDDFIMKRSNWAPKDRRFGAG